MSLNCGPQVHRPTCLLTDDPSSGPSSGLSRAPTKIPSTERTQKIAARENAGEARPLATAASGTRQPPPAAAAPAAGGRPPGAPRNLLLPATKTPKKLPHFPCLQPPTMAGTELKLGRRWPATHGPPRPNTPSRGAPPIRGEATPANYWALEAPEQGAPRRPPAAALQRLWSMAKARSTQNLSRGS